jgi:hypothetical protein
VYACGVFAVAEGTGVFKVGAVVTGGRMILSGKLSFTKGTLVGWTSGSWTRKGWDRAGRWPLRHEGGGGWIFWIKAPMVGLWNILCHMRYDWGGSWLHCLRLHRPLVKVLVSSPLWALDQLNCRTFAFLFYLVSPFWGKRQAVILFMTTL